MSIVRLEAKPKTPAEIERPSFLASDRAVLWAGVILIAMILGGWSGTLSVPFIFDDGLAVTDNPTIRKLGHLAEVLSPPLQNGNTVAGRPFVNLSFAFNYALGGTAVRGYHAINLLIHGLAGLTLLGVVRRTLLQAALRSRFGTDALPLALVVALLWAAHPLQTESVTYVSQRAESLVGLLYLLTLYGFIRSTASTVARRWWAAWSVFACLLGMATKEVMVSAPLIVVLYDRTFVAGTFRQAWRSRRGFYLGLASTWLLSGGLVLSTGSRGGTAGFGLGIAAWDYALTQCEAIVRYLGLALWPRPLVFDYGMSLVTSLASVGPQALLLILLLTGTVIALRRKSSFGFLGAWFFLILAPTSSVVPITTQTMAEHRMYLPLAALVAGAVLGGYALAGRKFVAIGLGLALALGLGTVRRNEDYRSELSLWRDTVEKRPANARAQNNLGKALMETGAVPAALTCFAAALRLSPDYPEMHNNLGYALTRVGQPEKALAHFEAAIRQRPNYARAHENFGHTLLQLGRVAAALGEFEAAVKISPHFTDAQCGLANALVQAGRAREGILHYEVVLRRDPAHADAHYGIAAALTQEGHETEAIPHYQEAIRLRPEFPEAQNNLGNVLVRLGRPSEAIDHYRQALRLKPDAVEARINLANLLLETGRPADAIEHYRLALKTKPAEPDAHFGLGNAFAQSDRMPAAIAAFREAVRLKPDHLAAWVNLANALLLTGQPAEAGWSYESALRLSPGDAALRASLEQARQLQRAGRN